MPVLPSGPHGPLEDIIYLSFFYFYFTREKKSVLSVLSNLRRVTDLQSVSVLVRLLWKFISTVLVLNYFVISTVRFGE